MLTAIEHAEALPCPLCGGKSYATKTVNGTQMFHVGCASCGLQLKAAWYRDEDKPTKDILSLWNTRAAEQRADTLAAEVEKFRTLAEQHRALERGLAAEVRDRASRIFVLEAEIARLRQAQKEKAELDEVARVDGKCDVPSAGTTAETVTSGAPSNSVTITMGLAEAGPVIDFIHAQGFHFHDSKGVMPSVDMQLSHALGGHGETRVSGSRRAVEAGEQHPATNTAADLAAENLRLAPQGDAHDIQQHGFTNRPSRTVLAKMYEKLAVDRDRLAAELGRANKTDPVKRLHNLVDALGTCDKCEGDPCVTDDEPTILCAKCFAGYKALAEELAALRQAQEWRDIASANTDEVILGAAFHKRHGWQWDRAKYQRYPALKIEEWTMENGMTPTLWLPLPALPRQQQDDK